MSVDIDMKVNKSVTIAAGGTVSTVLSKEHHKYMAIFLPSNWVTAIITFQGCATKNGTYIEMVHANDVGAVTVASIAASKCIVLDGEIMEAMLAVSYIKLVSSVAQTATDKVITIALMR